MRENCSVRVRESQCKSERERIQREREREREREKVSERMNKRQKKICRERENNE